MGMVRGIRRMATGLVLAMGLAGCATDPGNGLVYEDGSYYSPVGEGQGDYYVGRAYDRVRYVGDPFFDEFDWLYGGGPWYGGWYGSPFYGYGGYCSVRYRFCPRGGWADPFPRYDFGLYFGDPWARDYDRGDRWRDGVRRPWRPPATRLDPRDPRAQAPWPRPDAGQVPVQRQARPPRADDEDPFGNRGRARRGGGVRRDEPPPPRQVDKDGN